MRALVLRAVPVALALLAIPSAADAGWLATHTGFTSLGLPDESSDGVVNFGVYQTETEAGWASELTLGPNVVPSTAITTR